MRHAWNGRTVHLPGRLCRNACGAGYARDRARPRKGSTADTMHGAVQLAVVAAATDDRRAVGRRSSCFRLVWNGNRTPVNRREFDPSEQSELLERILGAMLYRTSSNHSASGASTTPCPAGAAAARHPRRPPPRRATLTHPQAAASLGPGAPPLEGLTSGAGRGRPGAATCCCRPPLASIRSLNHSRHRNRGTGQRR